MRPAAAQAGIGTLLLTGILTISLLPLSNRTPSVRCYTIPRHRERYVRINDLSIDLLQDHGFGRVQTGGGFHLPENG